MRQAKKHPLHTRARSESALRWCCLTSVGSAEDPKAVGQYSDFCSCRLIAERPLCPVQFSTGPVVLDCSVLPSPYQSGPAPVFIWVLLQHCCVAQCCCLPSTDWLGTWLVIFLIQETTEEIPKLGPNDTFNPHIALFDIFVQKMGF